ncbi:MAG: hypothetical protein WA783_06220 [Phormidesmis sp.]
MNLIALCLTVCIAWLLSNVMDIFPGVLWGWIHWPQWILWVLLLSVFAWGLDDGQPPS